ncbi:hypothetical protein Q4519_20615 [Motilimonas sp. 1_MG-2023]|uniref:hypothetical protein n=1 Tax=Motilimonas sp. 1_MG-2023 TaxID=3062672 RepID=UPI0026E273D7|nr:hypothetical protein [Motilimonas sp. 1_MG-2023]MDO6528082.1 hypothetical protein [Motilimonas sp. 1_MG-2023]
MKLGRCPICKSQLYLQQLIEDDAGREVMATLAKLDKHFGRQLMEYIALFRPEKSDLSLSRAAKLISEVLALTHNHDALREAVYQTVSSIKTKRLEGSNAQPLKNHNYLKQVLNTVSDGFNRGLKPEVKGNVEIKAQGRPESAAENKRKFEEQMAKFKGDRHVS